MYYANVGKLQSPNLMTVRQSSHLYVSSFNSVTYLL